MGQVYLAKCFIQLTIVPLLPLECHLENYTHNCHVKSSYKSALTIQTYPDHNHSNPSKTSKEKKSVDHPKSCLNLSTYNKQINFFFGHNKHRISMYNHYTCLRYQKSKNLQILGSKLDPNSV